jgi:hypothetical protein
LDSIYTFKISKYGKYAIAYDTLLNKDLISGGEFKQKTGYWIFTIDNRVFKGRTFVPFASLKVTSEANKMDPDFRMVTVYLDPTPSTGKVMGKIIGYVPSPNDIGGTLKIYNIEHEFDEVTS